MCRCNDQARENVLLQTRHTFDEDDGPRRTEPDIDAMRRWRRFDVIGSSSSWNGFSSSSSSGQSAANVEVSSMLLTLKWSGLTRMVIAVDGWPLKSSSSSITSHRCWLMDDDHRDCSWVMVSSPASAGGKWGWCQAAVPLCVGPSDSANKADDLEGSTERGLLVCVRDRRLNRPCEKNVYNRVGWLVVVFIFARCVNFFLWSGTTFFK